MPWLVVGLVLTVGVPLIYQWALGRPPRSGARVVAWSVGLALLVLAAAAAIGSRWIALGGLAAAFALCGWGIVRWRAERRALRSSLLAPENLLAGPPEIRVRPIRPDPVAALHGRLQQWLAADGPTPSPGWWLHGGLIVDAHGAALVDAAGLRHALPPAESLILRPVPLALVLLDRAGAVVAQLPPTGFTAADLQGLCRTAGWQYDDTAVLRGMARAALDLRRCVRDSDADHRMGRRLRREFDAIFRKA
jgi:hypothetical protein